MGFLSGLGRMIKGEPVFQPPPDDSGSGQTETIANNTPAHTPVGPTQIPKVTLERTQCHVDQNRSHMRVECVIQNDSSEEVFIDDMFMINNTKMNLDRRLEPGKEWEFTVYNGPRPNRIGGTNDDARLLFKKTIDGDYFTNYYAIEFRQERDGTYSVVRLRSSGQKDT